MQVALRSERPGCVEDDVDSRWLRGVRDKERGSFPEGAGGAKREFRKAAQAGAGSVGFSGRNGLETH